MSNIEIGLQLKDWVLVQFEISSSSQPLIIKHKPIEIFSFERNVEYNNLSFKINYMPTKVSEKRLVIAIISFVSSMVLLANATLFDAPVRVSEKGLLYFIIAFALIFFSLSSFRRSIVKH